MWSLLAPVGKRKTGTQKRMGVMQSMVSGLLCSRRIIDLSFSNARHGQGIGCCGPIGCSGEDDRCKTHHGNCGEAAHRITAIRFRALQRGPVFPFAEGPETIPRRKEDRAGQEKGRRCYQGALWAPCYLESARGRREGHRGSEDAVGGGAGGAPASGVETTEGGAGGSDCAAACVEIKAVRVERCFEGAAV